MRRFAWLLAVTVLLAAPGPAGATHQTQGCSRTEAVAYVGGFNCGFAVSCPPGAPHQCTWTLRVTAGGIGPVRGDLFSNSDIGCTGINSCSASKVGYVLPPGQSRAMTCNFTAEPLTVNPSVSCSATAS